MNGPYGPGESGAVYRLCQLFKSNPALHYRSIIIHENGAVEVHADGAHGVLRDWSRAVPDHRTRTALVATSYGCDEADVIEGDHIVVTVRRPLVGPGGVA